MRPAGWRRLLRIRSGAQDLERELDDELAFHLEMRARKLAARGMDADAARAEALRQFGDLEGFRSECLAIDRQWERTMRRANRWQELRQDVGYALRSLSQHRVFAAVILLSLGIGIGANTAIFTLIDALLLRTLPVPRAHELIVVGNPAWVNAVSTGVPITSAFSYPLYLDLRDGNRSVRSLAAMGRAGRLDVRADASEGADAELEHPPGRLVSGNYFEVLGVRAILGRTFGTEVDGAARAAPVAVISHGYWQRRYAGRRDIIGRTMLVNGSGYTIVGVTEPEFSGEAVGQLTDVWLPIAMQPAIMAGRSWLEDRSSNWLILMGRRLPGVTLEQARGDFNSLAYRIIDEHAPAADLEDRPPREPVPVGPGGKGISALRGRYADALTTLMAAVGLVLLVVCANVANLLFARAAMRRKEIGVRLALGASRARLIRQLLTESLILAGLGGTLGCAFAWWGSTMLLRLAGSGSTPVPLAVGLDWRVLGFTAALTLLTALLFGLAPALRAARTDLLPALRSHGRGLTGEGRGAGGIGVGRILVVAQVAISLTLLIAMSLLVRSTRRLESVDVGMAHDELLIVTVDAAPTGFEGERLAQLSRTLLERVRGVPGVTAASFSENGIFSGTESVTTIEVDGLAPGNEEAGTVNYDRIGPGYFASIGGRLLQGRDVGREDGPGAPRVAVVNRTMARFYFPDGDALGRTIRSDSVRLEIVGIAEDVQDHGLRDEPARRMYVPILQSIEAFPTAFTFEVRAAGDPASLRESVRRVLVETHASLRVLSVQPLTTLMRASINQDRLVARLVTFFGALALGLAALGLYGVMTFRSVRRTSEFGLRIALGARPAEVRSMVLGEALRLVAAGALLGLPLALAGSRLLRDQLFQVSAGDLTSVGLAVAMLMIVAGCAAYLPARRAGRVGPLIALRVE